MTWILFTSCGFCFIETTSNTEIEYWCLQIDLTVTYIFAFLLYKEKEREVEITGLTETGNVPLTFSQDFYIIIDQADLRACLLAMFCCRSVWICRKLGPLV